MIGSVITDRRDSNHACLAGGRFRIIGIERRLRGRLRSLNRPAVMNFKGRILRSRWNKQKSISPEQPNTVTADG